MLNKRTSPNPRHELILPLTTKPNVEINVKDELTNCEISLKDLRVHKRKLAVLCEVHPVLHSEIHIEVLHEVLLLMIGEGREREEE